MKKTETCQEKVYPPGRAVTGHVCGRKLKGDPEFPDLCGTHVAAIHRRRERDTARKLAETQHRDALRADQGRVEMLEGALDIALTLKTAMGDTGPDAFIHRTTGHVLVDIAELEKLARRVATPDVTEIRQAAENAHDSGYPAARFGDFLHGFQCAVSWLTGGGR